MELIKKELSKIVDNIILDGRKYNLIDRFFHYKIERENLYEKISIAKFTKENIKLNRVEFLTLHNEYLKEIDLKIEDLIKIIKNSFGIDDFVSYQMAGKAKIIDNPFLLGISPFLFSLIDFKKFIKSDIITSKIGYCAMDFHDVFKYSLNDTLHRLNSKVFIFYNDESIDDDDEFLFYDAGDILNLFRGEIFEVWDNFGVKGQEDKRKEQFLESEMFKKSIRSKIQINLPFELAEKVFKKYFEINFTTNKYNEIYPSFRIFLKALCNKDSLETKIKTIDLNEEEVKKMIGFFSCYKETDKSTNVFNYTIPKLIELMELISGLPQKTTWEKAHRDSNYKIDKNLEKEINSILPEKNPQAKNNSN